MIFTVPQVAAIRAGRMSGALVLPSESLRPGQVRLLRRLVRIGQRERAPARRGQPLDVLAFIDRHLDDRVSVDRVTERSSANDDPTPVLLTILAVEERDLGELTLSDARVCGYRTVSGLRDGWRAEHPRTWLVQLVAFGLGDLRDRPRYLSSLPMISDYTLNGRDAAPGEPEALSDKELTIYAAINGQRYARARAELATKLAMRSASHRLAIVEAAAARTRADVRRELRIIEQRVERAERRLTGSLYSDRF